MTFVKNCAANLDQPGRNETGDQLTNGVETGYSSQKRAGAANEVGSAIAHQLNGPLTALRLYVGEIRENSHRFGGVDDAEHGMHQMVEGAFREIERACAMMKLITEKFEEPLYLETAPALGRDVIAWWSRSGNNNGRPPEQSVSVQALLTPREREVLAQIRQGHSNKEGALRLKIGPRTFESHRFRLMRKLGARNGADLVRIVLGEKSAAR